MASGVSELDVRRLNKERPDLETDLIEFFAGAIERFVHAPQYAVLRNVRLAFFFDEDALDQAGFAEATFEELVNIGFFDVCILPGVTVELVESFVLVLEKLIEGGDDGVIDKMAETMFSAPPELEPVQTRGFDDMAYVPMSNPERERKGKELVLAGPVLNSVEAEKKLLEALDRIKKHPQIERFQDHTLDQYWHEEWIRAPFVEALNFNQLSKMNINNLLEKRTFSQHKIQAILECVDRVCTLFGQDASVPVSSSTMASAIPIASDVHREKISWRTVDRSKPIVISSVTALMEKEWESIGVARHIVVSFFEALSDKEGSFLLLEAHFGEEYLADLLDLEVEAVTKVVSAAQKKWRKAMKDKAGSQIENIERLLQSPAASISMLLSGDEDAFEDESLSKLFGSALLQSLGAEIAVVEEVELTDCWTMNDQGLRIVWDAIAAQAPKNKKTFITIASSMLPFVPASTLEMLWSESSIKPKRARG